MRHKPRSEHPLYATSSNTYGAKAVSQADLPLKYFPVQGEFTRVCLLSLFDVISWACTEIHLHARSF